MCPMVLYTYFFKTWRTKRALVPLFDIINIGSYLSNREWRFLYLFSQYLVYKSRHRFLILLHYNSCTKGGADFCATIPRVQKRAPFSAPLYFVYKRARRVLGPYNLVYKRRHRRLFNYTPFTKRGIDFYITVLLVQKRAPISVPLYLVYKREHRLPRHYTSCTKEGAEIGASFCTYRKYSGAEIRASLHIQGIQLWKFAPRTFYKCEVAWSVCATRPCL